MTDVKSEAYPWLALPGTIGTQEGAPFEGTLLMTANTLRQAYNSAFQNFGLGFAEASILVYIDAKGEPTQTEISQGVGAGRATTGIRLDALESRDLIVKRPDATDRRVWRVMLTPEGRRIVAQVNQVNNKMHDIAEAGLTSAELEVFVRCLLKVQRNIAAATAKSTATADALVE